MLLYGGRWGTAIRASYQICHRSRISNHGDIHQEKEAGFTLLQESYLLS